MLACWRTIGYDQSRSLRFFDLAPWVARECCVFVLCLDDTNCGCVVVGDDATCFRCDSNEVLARAGRSFRRIVVLRMPA